MAWTKPSSLYVIEALTGCSPYYYKIGHSTSVLRRVEQLQTGCPFKLRVHSSIGCRSVADAAALEKILLDEADWHNVSLRGEWIRTESQLSPHFLVFFMDTESADLSERAYA